MNSIMAMQDLWNKPLPEIRQFLACIPPSGGHLQAARIKIGAVPCELFDPPDAGTSKAIVYFHGGGFCLGIYPSNREFVATIAQSTHIKTVMPDYRLAPEQPFPAALDDAKAVLGELLKNEEKLIVMGDSSGCALALSALLALRQTKIKKPAAIVFLTPMLDFAGKGDSMKTRAKNDPSQMEDPLKIAKIYLGENDPYDPMFSPIYGAFENLPPALVHAADNDVFLSDAERLSQKMKDAGCRCDLKIWPNMWHIFHMQGAVVPDAATALHEIYNFIISI
jgi:monoterpene epsilon-lactone hydrolase